MSHTITVRLTPELSAWLEETSSKTGLSQGHIVRQQLEMARTKASSRRYMRLAGAVRGASDLSSRRGFSCS